MEIERVTERGIHIPSVSEDVKWVLGNAPITVVALWVIMWYLASNGLYYHDVFGYDGAESLFSIFFLMPFYHGDWGHFAGNMAGWIPAGIALTLLTNNRHTLLIVVVSDFLTQVIGIVAQGGYGFSSAVLAVRAAVLVHAIGISFQDAPDWALQTAVGIVMTLVSAGFFFVALLAGPNQTIGHFSHFFGLLFGGAIESMYVFNKYGGDDGGDDERSVPGRMVQ